MTFLQKFSRSPTRIVSPRKCASVSYNHTDKNLSSVSAEGELFSVEALVIAQEEICGEDSVSDKKFAASKSVSHMLLFRTENATAASNVSCSSVV